VIDGDLIEHVCQLDDIKMILGNFHFLTNCGPGERQHDSMRGGRCFSRMGCGIRRQMARLVGRARQLLRRLVAVGHAGQHDRVELAASWGASEIEPSIGMASGWPAGR
jgi:hypothetical protein